MLDTCIPYFIPEDWVEWDIEVIVVGSPTVSIGWGSDTSVAWGSATVGIGWGSGPSVTRVGIGWGSGPSVTRVGIGWGSGPSVAWGSATVSIGWESDPFVAVSTAWGSETVGIGWGVVAVSVVRGSAAVSIGLGVAADSTGWGSAVFHMKLLLFSLIVSHRSTMYIGTATYCASPSSFSLSLIAERLSTRPPNPEARSRIVLYMYVHVCQSHFRNSATMYSHVQEFLSGVRRSWRTLDIA